MAFEWGPQIITSHAATAAIEDGVIVKITDAGVAPVEATTDTPYGISTTAVEGAERTARVGLVGVFKARAGAAIAIGKPLSYNASGEVIAATTGASIVGTAVEAATAQGEYIAVALSTPGAGTVAA